MSSQTNVTRPLWGLLLSLACCLMLASCAGYQLATSGTSVLGDGTKTLKVKGVDYPTLHPWMPHQVRSVLRDEVNSRYLAKWVDSGSADYEIQINILSYTTREWARTEWDTAQLYDSTIGLEAVVYEGSTNKEVWRSDPIYYSERLEQVDEKQAAGDIINQLVRILADRMRDTF